MPDFVIKELWQLIPTVAYFVVGLTLFGLSVKIMDAVAPFSIRKEIEEDQNTSLGILMGSTILALSILLSAAIR